MLATHLVDLTGPLDGVRFPNLCVACGVTPPAGDVPLEKMFRRTYHESPTTYEYANVRVPLCARCLTVHERARGPIDPAALRRLRRQWALKILPYVFPTSAILWLLAHLTPLLARSGTALLGRSRNWGDLLVLGIVLFFAFCLYGFVRASLDAGRPLVDRTGDLGDAYVRTQRGALGSWYVVPDGPTPPLAAVDFGDEQFEILAPNHRTFRFASADVAARFAAVNADRVWDPASPQARQASRVQRLAVVAVVVAVLGAAVWQLLPFR